MKAVLATIACLVFIAIGQAADPVSPDYFVKTVYPILLKGGCQGCHGPDGVAAGTRLHLPEGEVSRANIERFGLSLGALVDRQAPGQSLLVNKPTKRVAHAGGKRFEPGSPDETALRTWADYLAKQPILQGHGAEEEPPAEPRAKAVPALRRLTHFQYDNTIRDLLGDESRLANQFPLEDFVGGFKNQFATQSTSPLLAEAYSVAAEKLARNAFRGGDTKSLIPCKPSSPADAACRTKFIREFGKKAFRRPVSEIEAGRYSKLFAAEALRAKSFIAGAQIVVEGMLQSPAFLLRAENGVDPAYRPYEIASQLSYFIWNSMPDQDLLNAAGKGELSTPAGLEAAARRLLAAPKAKASFDDFIAQWLRYDRLIGGVKERRQFPQYNLELSVAMTEESRRLISDLVWKDGDFRKTFSAGYSFLSTDLANLYGVPAPSTEFAKVDLPPATGRAGILGHALFLALTSKPADTSPTARGLFVREQFLCQEVPQPPPGVSTNLPALSKAKPQTNRERLAVHLTSESCSVCHSLIDPIGFGLEKYDAIGQRREKAKIVFPRERGDDDDKKPESVDLELKTDGFIAGIKSSEFDSPATLGRVLAESVQCQECVVKQVFRYAMGRKETPADRPLIRQSFEDFRKSEFRMKELMVSLLKWSVYPSGRNGSDVSSSGH